MHIKSIKKIEQTEFVYDLTVKDTHCYFANGILVHNCHRISDIVFNQRLLPMLGSFDVAKVIKMGISMYKNNFWKSCCGSGTRYSVITKNWTQCPILLNQGSIFYNGQEYSKYVLDRMPLSMKQKMFPDRPDLHYDGDFSEIDFKTQYAMEWVNDINLVLNEEDQKKLVSGTHDILTKARKELQEKYFFGLDTASGTILPGKRDLDFTHLAIWRKNQDNSKEKVASYEWQSEILQQIDEIKEIIHPERGIFPCVFGLADYSNIAIGLVETFKREKIPIEGIMFNGTEPITHKNFKNAMFDQFVFELQSGRIKYPLLEQIEKNKLFKKSMNEWFAIERHKKLGINDSLGAPSDFHDDSCAADIMAVWAADRVSSFDGAVSKMTQMPNPTGGTITNLAGRMIPFPGPQGPRSKYLGGKE